MKNAADVLGDILTVKKESALIWEQFRSLKQATLTANNLKMKQGMLDYFDAIGLAGILGKKFDDRSLVSFHFDDFCLTGRIEITDVYDFPDLLIDLMEEHEGDFDLDNYYRFVFHREEGSRYFENEYGPCIVIDFCHGRNSSFVYDMDEGKTVIESRGDIYKENGMHLSLIVELYQHENGVYNSIVDIDCYGSFSSFNESVYDDTCFGILDKKYKLQFSKDINSPVYQLKNFFDLLVKLDDESVNVYEIYDCFDIHCDGDSEVSDVNDIDVTYFIVDSVICYQLTCRVNHVSNNGDDDSCDLGKGYHLMKVTKRLADNDFYEI